MTCRPQFTIAPANTTRPLAATAVYRPMLYSQLALCRPMFYQAHVLRVPSNVVLAATAVSRQLVDCANFLAIRLLARERQSMLDLPWFMQKQGNNGTPTRCGQWVSRIPCGEEKLLYLTLSSALGYDLAPNPAVIKESSICSSPVEATDQAFG